MRFGYLQVGSGAAHSAAEGVRIAPGTLHYAVQGMTHAFRVCSNRLWKLVGCFRVCTNVAAALTTSEERAPARSWSIVVTKSGDTVTRNRSIGLVRQYRSLAILHIELTRFSETASRFDDVPYQI